MIASLRKLYRRFVRVPILDRAIYAVLDALTNAYANLCGFHFPSNYIRRWKLDMLSERYERETVELFRKIIRPGMTVADIGAHIGYFTRLFSKLVGQKGHVCAFEADRANYVLLEYNTRRMRNVRLIPLAVMDKKGIIDFYHYDDKSGAHSTLQNAPLSYEKRKLTVPATDLDSWVMEQGLTSIDVIKMDIEGGESAAFRGMSQALQNARMLVVEFAPAWIKASGGTPRDFLETIERYGFDLFAITTQGLVRFNSSTAWQTFFPNREDDSHMNEFINLYCVKKS